ncbi:MAG: YeeE/YedE thiosulfate transporter family protein [Paracoccaceae bacterium]|nr:YeeE/YedE thiosulfate transporter family protein [Paracoccaceae bacterium]
MAYLALSYALSLLMGAILGFAAHRAGLCTVKAVAEVLTTRRAHLLWSFGKSALWVMALTAVAGAFSLTAGLQHWPLSAASVAGGVLFGLGAGLNGGCTFSTLSRLMDGNLNMLATVIGWPLGLGLGLQLWSLSSHAPLATSAAAGQTLHGALVWALAIWALWEGWHTVRRLMGLGGLRRILGAPVYTLSAAAALLGLSNAVLLETAGPWSFTGTFLCALDAGTLARCADPVLPWAIFAAALVGMVLSALQRGSFVLRRPRPRNLLRGGVAGVMMGLGAVLIPGGNDGLILFAIPALSPHALPAYGGILAGILAALLAMRALGRTLPPIACQGDICRAQM